MQLCTFEVATRVGRFKRLGALRDGKIIDLNFAMAAHLRDAGEPRPGKLADVLLPSSMLEFLKAGDRAITQASILIANPPEGEGPNGETLIYDPAEVQLKAPIPNPPSLRDFYAFEEHVKAGFAKRQEVMPREWYEIPVYYKSGHHNVIGTGADVLWPRFTEKFDYEIELAAVIGKQGRNIPAAQARGYIAGFTVMNDFSARDIQKREMKVRLGPAKGKDWCTALGPLLVTTEEIGDPYSLAMTAAVNGEVWSRGHSGDIYWKFEQMIEFLTEDDTIYPGDVIGSGTAATGCGLELDRWVQPGDLMELTIEKIGTLRNRVRK